MPRDTIELQPETTGLSYVNDDDAGIRRVAAGEGFAYRDPDGRPVKDHETLERIRSLAIPPRLDRYLDMPLPARPHPGDGPRSEGAQAVPLS